MKGILLPIGKSLFSLFIIIFLLIQILINSPKVCVWIARFQRAIQHLRFWLGSTALFRTQPKMQKHVYQCIFRSYGIIHTFKNYFATMFSAISFQFLVNKQYSNTSKIWERERDVLHVIKNKKMQRENLKIDSRHLWYFSII